MCSEICCYFKSSSATLKGPTNTYNTSEPTSIVYGEKNHLKLGNYGMEDHRFSELGGHIQKARGHEVIWPQSIHIK